jgi:hypothetical protein
MTNPYRSKAASMRSNASQFPISIRMSALVAAAMSGLAIQAPDASANPICGIEFESASQVQEQVELKKQLPGNTSDPMYVTYYDGGENVSWAFTTTAHAAHPAVICRRMEQKDGKFEIAMEIRCNATKLVCDELYESFVRLNKITTKRMNAQQQSQ